MEQDRQEKARGQDAGQATAGQDVRRQMPQTQAGARERAEAWEQDAAKVWETALGTVEDAGRAAAAGAEELCIQDTGCGP